MTIPTVGVVEPASSTGGGDFHTSVSAGGFRGSIARPSTSSALGGSSGAGSGLALVASAAVGAASAPTAAAQVLPPRYDEDVELPLIKVVVLGAPGVGKTALVKVRN